MVEPRRRLAAAERRRRVIEAAIEEFGSHGYHGASLERLAAAAGVTKPVVYDHFASKRELYVQVMRAISEELLQLSIPPERGSRVSEPLLRAAVDAFFRYVEQRPAAARVLFLIPRGEPELLEGWRALQEQVTLRLAALLSGGRPPSRLRLVEAEFLKQAMHGLAEWWTWHPETPRRVLVDAAARLAWRGVSGAVEASTRRQASRAS